MGSGDKPQVVRSVRKHLLPVETSFQLLLGTFQTGFQRSPGWPGAHCVAKVDMESPFHHADVHSAGIEPKPLHMLAWALLTELQPWPLFFFFLTNKFYCVYLKHTTCCHRVHIDSKMVTIAKQINISITSLCCPFFLCVPRTAKICSYREKKISQIQCNSINCPALETAFSCPAATSAL